MDVTFETLSKFFGAYFEFLKFFPNCENIVLEQNVYGENFLQLNISNTITAWRLPSKQGLSILKAEPDKFKTSFSITVNRTEKKIEAEAKEI